MPTLDWLNRANAFTLANKVPYRLLVVEYKGDGYATSDDSREKRLVGERWAQTTGQRFVMVGKTLNGMDMAGQIRAAAA
jgi:hypothetical protein